MPDDGWEEWTEDNVDTAPQVTAAQHSAENLTFALPSSMPHLPQLPRTSNIFSFFILAHASVAQDDSIAKLESQVKEKEEKLARLRAKFQESALRQGLDVQISDELKKAGAVVEEEELEASQDESSSNYRTLNVRSLISMDIPEDLRLSPDFGFDSYKEYESETDNESENGANKHRGQILLTSFRPKLASCEGHSQSRKQQRSWHDSISLCYPFM